TPFASWLVTKNTKASTAREVWHDRYDHVPGRPFHADAGLPGCLHLWWRGAVFRNLCGRHGPVRLHALPNHECHAEHRADGGAPVHIHGGGTAAHQTGGAATDLHGPAVWWPARRPGDLHHPG